MPDRLCYDMYSRVRGRPSVGAGPEPVGDHARNDNDRSSRFNSSLGSPCVRNQLPVKNKRTYSDAHGSHSLTWRILRQACCGARLTARSTSSTHAKPPVRVIQPCLAPSTSSGTESLIHCLNRPHSSTCASSRTRTGNTDSVILRPPNHQIHS